MLSFRPGWTSLKLIKAGFAIRELQGCGFVVHAREPDMEYRVRIGDIVVQTRPMAIHKEVYWEDSTYFESAAGQVFAYLESRSTPTASWRLRASLAVIVSPEKLGYARYLAMIEDLCRISEGLVFDLISKSQRAFQLTESGRWGISLRAAHLELRVLEDLWEQLSVCIRDILSDPTTSLRFVRERGRSWGANV
jgi:hypothetical protein